MPSNRASLAGKDRKVLDHVLKSRAPRGALEIVLRSASIAAISNARVAEAKAVALRKVVPSSRRVAGASQRLEGSYGGISE